MINKIILKNTASFKNPTTLETDKKINLVYGLNGTGKTTIADYLQTLNPEQEETQKITKNSSDNLFEDCSIEGFNEDTQKILVYNQNFITENFYENETQKGIFTLAKENKEASQAIKNAENEQKTLEEKLKNEENGLNKKLQEQEGHLLNAQENVWEIKTTYTGGDRVFDNAGFLDRLKGKRETLFNYLKDIKLEEPQKTIDEIKKELQEISEDAVPRDEISYLEPNDYTKIEQKEIFQEEIIGNQNSTVSNLIEELSNSDWVKKGLEYVDINKRRNCPFCQEKTLTDDLVKDIESYFDKMYEEKIEKLNSLKTEYQNLKSNLNLDEYKKSFLTNEQHLEIEKLFNSFNHILGDNLKNIANKINQPSTKIQLSSSQQAIKDINTWIEERNIEINDFNKKLQNINETKENLKAEFWRIQRKEYNTTIVQYQEQETKLTNEKKIIEKSIEDTKAKINAQDGIIQENQKKITNIEQTIEAINQHLLDFGIQYFEIVKHEKDKYKIQRGEEQQEETFKSLSEGEKTVISFLYFIELCKGKESQTDTKEKIIVIDDPISSLSYMYVFNVAQLIKSTFFSSNDFLQCFILTHNLYFFHELIDKNDFTIKDKEEKDRKQKLFRVEKDTESKILEMKHNEIQNEYESYWHIVNNAKQENRFIVANAMRNIIEYFFSFIERHDSINNIFQKEKFKDNQFQAFKRYINRESHSDATNIYDFKEFDIGNFKEAFKEMFTGYTEHYNKFSKIGKKT